MPEYFRTPGPMGYNCDHIIKNPAWTPDSDIAPLLRCYTPAVVRITFEANGVVSVTKRCPACADILKQQTKTTILQQEQLK